MRTGWWVRVGAVCAAFALAAAACGDDGDDKADEKADIQAKPATDRLVIGSLRAETGSLAPLGPPVVEGTNLAVEDVNAAGGVLGQQVELLTGDEGDDAARVSESLSRMLGEGANAIVGAMASGQSQEILQTLSDEQIPECSPSNTSTVFGDQRNANFYFRTVPPDAAVAPVFADKILADGRSNIAVVARQDDYGETLLRETVTALQSRGATVAAQVTYDPDATTFDSEVEEITAANPDAVVVVSFAEGGPLVSGLLEAGLTPDRLYGGDGIFDPKFGEEVDPDNANVIDGMVFIGASGGVDFNTRLNEALPGNEKGNFIYGGQAYDCVVLLALAAQAAGSVSGPGVIEQVEAVAADGTDCATFAECKALLDQGQDINYIGESGPWNLVRERGSADPTIGRYAIAVARGGALEVIGQQDVDLATVGG
jgi:ABC-type branched-subunit amino acid transport system substrate-binding protein